MPSLKAMAKEFKTKKPMVTKKAAQKVSPPTKLSSEFVEDSDDESEESGTDLLSDDESLPEKAAVEAPKSNGKTAAPAIDSSSSSGSESGSVDDSHSEDEEVEQDLVESIIGALVPLKPARQQPPKEATTTSMSSSETSRYQPPVGFEPAPIDGAPKASQLFSKSSLEGKQIWYITTPASVSISSIEQMSMQDLKSGKAILDHHGHEYGFVQDTPDSDTYTKILLPTRSDNGYRAGSKSIDQILHLQQIMKLPAAYDSKRKETASSTSARATVPKEKPIRQQPVGLKMRFRPIGFGGGETGNIGSSSFSAHESSSASLSDAEVEDASSKFRRPASLGPEESETSSGSSESNSSSTSDAEMTDAPPLPSKPVENSKLAKSAATELSKPADRSLKRKPSQGGDTKANKSSSSSATSIDNRELKENQEKANKFSSRESISVN